MGCSKDYKKHKVRGKKRGIEFDERQGREGRVKWDVTPMGSVKESEDGENGK